MTDARDHRGTRGLDAGVLDALWTAVVVTDGDGIVTAWNTEAERLYGWSGDEAVGRSVYDLTVLADDVDRASQIMERLSRGEPWEGTFRVRRKDGSSFLAHVRNVALRDANGAIVGVVGVSYDLARGLFGSAGALEAPDRVAYQLDQLQSLTARLAETMTVEDAASVVLDEGLAVFEADAAVLCRLRDDGRLEVVAHTGYPPEIISLLTDTPVDQLEMPVAVAARTGRPVVLESGAVLKEAYPLMAEHRPGREALVAVPLIVAGKTVGGLAVAFDRPRRFSDADHRFLLSVANACAQALHRAELYARVDENLRVLDAFMDAAPVGLAILDDERRFVLVNRYLARVDGLPPEEHLGRRIDEVLADTEPDVVPIIQSVLETGVAVAGVEVQGPVGEGRVVLASWYPVAGPAGSKRVGIMLTDITARREAESRLREESQIVETLHFVGRRLAGELEPHRVMDVVTQAATLVTGAELGVFVEARDGTPHVAAQSGEAGSFVATLPPVLLEPTLVQHEVVRVAELGGDTGVASFLGVPVVSRSGEALGGLFLVHAKADVFDPRDERLVVGIAGQAAVALDNAGLYQAERDARQRLAILAEAGRVLSETLEFDTMMHNVAGIATQLADVCLIDLVADDGTIRRFVAVADGDESVRAEFEQRVPGPANPGSPTLSVLATGQPRVVAIDDGWIRSTFPDEAYQAFLIGRYTSAIIVPIVARQNLMGTLAFIDGPSGRALSESDLPMFLDLARRVGVAFDNALHYARERTVAEQLQQSLLPDRLPRIPGVRMASRYLPGGPDVEVGGDWYDVLPLPDGRVGFAIGDVVGRGVRAAALMGQLRSALRAYALDGYTPGACLLRLDRMVEVLTGGALVTVIKSHFDPRSGRLELSNAGHLPMLLLGPDGHASFVRDALAYPLTTVDDPEYPDAVVTIEPGTTIVLYTDGLVERPDAPIDEGLRRLADAVRTGPDDLEALCDHVLSSLLGGDRKRDDVALLVVRYDGAP